MHDRGPSPGESPYDRALQRLHAHGPSLTSGLFNHAPMVVEALDRMGAPGAIPAWLAAEAASFGPRPAARDPIREDAWRSQLGEPDRFGDWSVFFDRAFEREGWPSVLDAWVARLAPGFTTAACHGMLRTAHAARALATRDTPLRRRELAEGLASWACMYTELPVRAAGPAGAQPPDEALRELRPVPPELRKSSGFITTGYLSLASAKDFEAQVARVDLSGPVPERVDELVRVFARLFCAAADTPFLAIVLAHAVTGAAAVRSLHPHLSPETSAALLFRAWEGGCALRAAFAGEEVGDGKPSDDPTRALREAIRAAAVAHGDDHVVKLTEACLGAHARTGAPELLEAALHVRRSLDPKPGFQLPTG